MIHGQDWSSYQASEPSVSGLDFVFVKRTEGLNYVNPKARLQTGHARSKGLVIGHYHYPHIANSASAEADYFLRELGADLHAGDVLCLDWEWYGQKVSNASARAYKDAFVSRIRLKAPAHRIVVYSNRDDWTRVDTDSNCGDGLWIADPTTSGKPRVDHAWTFHQYSAGSVDKDVANFSSLAALKEWAGTKTIPTKKTEDDDMQLTDAVKLNTWIPQTWPTDTGVKDGKVSVETALGSTYGHARAAHDASTAMLAQLAALTAVITAMSKEGGLTAEQATAAATAGAKAALAELGHSLTS